MIIKKSLLIMICFFCFFTSELSFSENNTDIVNIISPKSILIIYDQKYKIGDFTDYLTAYEGLIGHFDLTSSHMQDKIYKKNDINNYDYIMIINVNNEIKNKFLFEDLKDTSKTVFWIGGGINKLIEKTNINMHFENNQYTYNTLKHYNDNFIKTYSVDNVNNIPLLTLSKNSTIYTKLSNGIINSPYIFKNDNFVFKLNVAAYEEEYYAFADVLFNFFTSKFPIIKTATIRIEDIHPLRDPEKLKKIADFLYDRNIPFMMVVIPAYLNFKTDKIITLSDKPKLVEALKYMQNHGGRVILHGFKHTFHKRFTTGEGYELWDGYLSRPLDVNIKTYVNKLVSKGLNVCYKNGLYPIAFEAPHYAASQDAYKELSKYFTTIVGQIQTSDYHFTTLTFPYETTNISQAKFVIPENLEYYNPNNNNPLRSIEKKLNELSMMRSYTAGVFFHPYLTIDELKATVNLIESKGLKFKDPLENNFSVKTKDLSITFKNHTPKIDTYNKNLLSNRLSIFSNYFFDFMLIILIIATISFLVFYITNLKSRTYFRRIKKHYEDI
ncbi:DUF2334 domain-containing protein [Helicovermis profundi]|uniref:Polysaccharide deacetylase family protein n=1 Tax=Helicovermis profundi TaxID=3065157 RepID=A0AAU9ERV7_9FIRM|nr:polysaccharide deacetylase family protein [Clostridia bacterium S502]